MSNLQAALSFYAAQIEMIGKAHSSDRDDYVYLMRGKAVAEKQVN